jgi:hypothetical protein
MKMLQRPKRRMSRLGNLLRFDFVLNEAMGSNMIEARANLQAAMTSGGASARRINIAAKETDTTPKNRIMYGLTIEVLSLPLILSIIIGSQDARCLINT